MVNSAETIALPVVLDNTVLTNFALVDRTDVVMRLWPSTACTTQAALNEYQLGAACGLVPAHEWGSLPILSMTDEETALAASLSSKLGAGERTCLAVAIGRRGLFVTDDLNARRTASQHGASVSGTIGILVLSVKRGYLSREQADTLLAEMIALGYRSPVASLAVLLNEP